MVDENFYDDSFYDMTIRTEASNAHVVAKSIMDAFHPKSLIDLGCGCGIYLKAFHDLGMTDLIGYDGSAHAVTKSLAPKGLVVHQDLTTFEPDRRYDMCLCIEVAEHIRPQFSDDLVRLAVKCSDTVIFTAAPPGQGGTNHINLQPKENWTKRFNDNGFTHEAELSKTWSDYFKKENVVWWIWKNISIYRKIA